MVEPLNERLGADVADPHGGVEAVSWADPAKSGDDTESVHLAEEWEAPVRQQVRSVQNWFFQVHSIASEGATLGIMVAFTAGVILAARSSMSLLALTVGAGVVIAIVVLLFRRGLRRRFPGRWDVFPKASDPRYRVRVIGRPDLLEALRRSPPSVTAGFEPGIFRITCALEPQAQRRLKAVLLCGGISVILFAIQWVLVGNVSAMYVTVLFACAMARSARAFVWPTYLRISPSRLDVMQYRVLGMGKPAIRTFDLRACRIAMQIHGPLIVYPPGSNDGELFPAASSPLWGGDALEFTRTVLAAALTTAEAAPLPDDDLLG